MTITKMHISNHLIESLDLSKKDAKEMVDLVFETIAENLVKGKSVKLSSFGNFELKDKKERPGLNPKTKEFAMVSARRVVTFKAGQKLKDFLNKSDDEIEDT